MFGICLYYGDNSIDYAIPGIEKSDSIDETALVAKPYCLSCNVMIEAGVIIEADCVIQRNTCFLKHTQIGNRKSIAGNITFICLCNNCR
ncbi:MAG: hypothetical protein IPO27_02450 [Bacteroidetes bacterium]|nr:hypothetical protein [Bacteroidota bacterium]